MLNKSAGITSFYKTFRDEFVLIINEENVCSFCGSDYGIFLSVLNKTEAIGITNLGRIGNQTVLMPVIQQRDILKRLCFQRVILKENNSPKSYVKNPSHLNQR
ncbi:hypothetical protein D3C80_1204270 [compost metagenome]